MSSAADFLSRHLPGYLADLEALVNLDSGTFDKAGVDAVGERLQAHYRELGATVEVQAHPTYGDSFVARMKGTGVGRVLLLGHTDTVYPLGTAAKRPFRLEEERAIGPGTSDMKSGDLAIVYALRSLRDQGFMNFAQIAVVHNSDEEVGSPTSRPLIRAESEAADAVFVLEAGRENGDIVSSRKGIADCRLHVHGRSAHAGVNHRRGRSAVLELAHLVTSLEGLNGVVAGATLNVGRLEAGERPNVVPDYGFAHFEVRAFDSQSLHAMIREVEAVTEKRTVPDTWAELQVSVEHEPMHKSKESARLVSLAQCLALELGVNLRDTATGGASDGNIAAEAGRPVLDGLGPIGGSAHSPGEYINTRSVVPRTAILAGLIAAVGSGSW